MKSSTASLWIILALGCLLRFSSLDALDLMDPTEGRYASIAQQMYLSRDWTTQRTFKEGELIPFWGKPPLHSWLTAASFAWFGMGELSARLPSFVAGMLSLALIFWFSRNTFGQTSGILTVLALLTSFLFFFISGICMTDPLLSLGLLLSGVSFANYVKTTGVPARWWGRLFFVALGFGMLVKGPVAIALVAAALIPWIVVRREYPAIFNLPWFSGSLLFVAATLPWFLDAEIASPGFLNYFFVHENFLRFLVSDYGDKYGSSHTHFFGYIWLMFIGAFFPWTFLWLGALWKDRRFATEGLLSDRWLSYCLCWGAAPMLFFTFAKQTSFYYVLPGLPWLAVCTAVLIEKILATKPHWLNVFSKGNALVSSICALGLVVFGSFFELKPHFLVASFGLLFFAAFFFWRACQTKTSANWFRLSVYSTLALFTIAVLNLSAVLSAKLSSKGVVEYLDHNLAPQPESATFLAKIPNSAYFYSREDPSDRLKLESAEGDRAQLSSQEYLILKDEDLEVDSEAALKDHPSRKDFGTWNLLTRNSSE